MLYKGLIKAFFVAVKDQVVMDVVDKVALADMLMQAGGESWLPTLLNRLQQVEFGLNHGDLPKWQAVIDCMPQLSIPDVDLKDQVRIGGRQSINADMRHCIYDALKALHPWRKGPFYVHDIEIDTEWRSDWKWDRLKQHIAPLKNRLVLDVGCGNGYHCWRMLGEEAKGVLGIDPMLLNCMQFNAIKRLHGEAPIFVLPMAIEDFPLDNRLFDTVFSMGVLYHRRSPIDHLLELKSCLRSGGELVLETLVVEGDESTLLLPEHRYAQMRNVWFLPSPLLLMRWLRRCGFRNVRLVNVSRTTVEEQRSSDWMQFQSLKDYLHPDNPDLTCEGLPAPVRAIVIAEVD